MMVSIPSIAFAIEMADLDDNERYFKFGLQTFNQLKMLIHYHLKCSHFTDNTDDIEFLMMVSIPSIAFAIEMADLDDNERYFKFGLQTFNQLKMLIHYHLKCRHFTDNTGEIEI